MRVKQSYEEVIAGLVISPFMGGNINFSAITARPSNRKSTHPKRRKFRCHILKT
jgi:hypothetical protein